MTKKNYINSRFDVDSLKKFDYFKYTRTDKDFEYLICQLFEIKDIFEYEKIWLGRQAEVKADINKFSIN